MQKSEIENIQIATLKAKKSSYSDDWDCEFLNWRAMDRLIAIDAAIVSKAVARADSEVPQRKEGNSPSPDEKSFF